jgi:two-component system LytT family response regulator
MIRAIIVDDEKNQVNELKSMLESYHSDVSVVDVCYNIKEFELALQKIRPDLVFLDVELGKSQTSFDLLRKISLINFEIIFTTSYNKYAIDAIRLSAIDFLLKPIDEIELKVAIERYRAKKLKADSGKIESLLTAWANPGSQENKIPIPTISGYDLVKIADIIYFETVNNQTQAILTNGKNIIVSITLKECEDILTPCRFFRIHKSYLINLNHVKKYIKGKDGTVVMTNDANLTVSRGIKDRFIETLRTP